MTDKKKRKLDGWKKTVGDTRRHRVTVFEHIGRDRVLYLRWRENVVDVATGRARRVERFASLERTLPAPTGKRLDKKALEEAQEQATKDAERRYGILTGAIVEAAPVVVAIADGEWPRTIGATEAKLLDPVIGRFPRGADGSAGYRRAMLRAIRTAVSEWGGETRWADVKYDHWVALWRGRMRTLAAADRVGYAGARDTVVRLVEVLTWLIDHEHLPADTRMPRAARWAKDFDKDYAMLVGRGDVPTPARPRYTLDEMLALLHVAPRVDPRLALALAIGAEQRNGQVLRVKRSQVVLPAVDWTRAGDALHAQEFGTVEILGRGKKGGATIDLTAGQRRALDAALGYAVAGQGYLRELEAAYVDGELPDFALFVTSPLTGRRTAPQAPETWLVPVVNTVGGSLVAEPARALVPMSGAQLRDWLRAAEDAVEPVPIPHIDGRAFYGMRRQGVDAAYDEGISDDGIQAQGGWSSPDMARDVYRDQGKWAKEARREARDVRSRFRRETTSDTNEPPINSRTARTIHELATGDVETGAALTGGSDE